MHCQECGFTYEDLGTRDVPVTLRDWAHRYAEPLRRADRAARLRSRPAPGVWSPLEYACHVRDVLRVQRDRLHLAQRVDVPTFAPMGREQRVVEDRYDEQDAEVVLHELAGAADVLAEDLSTLDAAGWERTGIYNYPEPTERTMAWLARHTVHELVHHLRDIEQGVESSPESGR